MSSIQEMVGEQQEKNLYSRLLDLANGWESFARSKQGRAEREKSPAGRMMVEQSARCYFDCAKALKKCLTDALPESLTNSSGDQT